jgi:hypothetical protein
VINITIVDDCLFSFTSTSLQCKNKLIIKHCFMLNIIKKTVLLLAIFASVFISCDKDYDDDYNNKPPVIDATVFSAAGDSASIVSKLNELRTTLGDPLNSTPNQNAGRREINWDGVPANLTNNNNFPFDFFNNTDPAGPNGRKRGLVYANTGTAFRVDSTDFSELEPTYANQFEAFSRKRLFAYIGSNVTELSFKLPGTITDASVKGFGVIFSDVDDASSTFVEFFNDNKSLGVFKAPTANGASKFSLLGVHFPTEKITRVKITAGNGLLAKGIKDITDGGDRDLVVMDDFLYSEPVAK